MIDPLIEDLIREEARFAGIEPQIYTTTDLQTQVVQALAKEARALLVDGTAPGADDIARVLRHGLGFPIGAVPV